MSLQIVMHYKRQVQNHESHNSETLSNLGIRKYFPLETELELSTEVCSGKGEESSREETSQQGLRPRGIQELRERQCDRKFKSLGDLGVRRGRKVSGQTSRGYVAFVMGKVKIICELPSLSTGDRGTQERNLALEIVAFSGNQ